jgi:uncharacterized Zn finger protein (UPF0148 family)
MIHCPCCQTIIFILPDGLAGCAKCKKVFEVVILEREKNPPPPEKT